MKDFDTILDEIRSAIVSKPELAPLVQNPVAEWEQWAYVFAQISYEREQVLWDLLQLALAKRAEEKVHTPKWLRDQAFRWQFGYQLQMTGGVPGYSVDDPAARLVAAASLTEIAGVSLIKVAKQGSGSLVPLLPSEISSLEAYYQQVRHPGDRTSIVSINPGQLAVYGDLHIDPLRPVPDYIQDVATSQENFRLELPFNGEILVSRITDKLQQIEGVHDVHNIRVTIDEGSGPVTIDRNHIPLAGYVIESGANPLASTINYIPHV